MNIKVNSKKVKPNDVFVAIKGNTYDGHQFIDEAIKNGASSIICEYGTYSIPYVKVSNTKEYLNNYLYTHYYDKIKDSCTKLTLTPELNQKYNYRPEALSTDRYNTPNLWYLILYVNGCEDSSEFHDLDYVLLPDMSVITHCLSDEEYIGKKKIL